MHFSELTRGVFAYRSIIPTNGYQLRDISGTFGDAVSSRQEQRLRLVENWSTSEERSARIARALKRDDIHRIFAGLYTTEEKLPKRILAFANRYGLLGIDSHPVMSPTQGEREFTVSTEDPMVESIEVWRKEIEEMAALVKIWDTIQREHTGTLAQVIRWSDTGDSVWMAYAYTLDARKELLPLTTQVTRTPEGGYLCNGRPVILQKRRIAHIELDAEVMALWRKGQIIGPARQYVFDEIARRLHGKVHARALQPNSTLSFQPDNLLVALYVMFLLEVTGQIRGKQQCAYCSTYYSPTRSGGRFCSDACRRKSFRQKRKASSE